MKLTKTSLSLGFCSLNLLRWADHGALSRHYWKGIKYTGQRVVYADASYGSSANLEIMIIPRALVPWVSRFWRKAAPQPTAIELLDEVMGRILETWGGRYTFDFDRVHLVIKFTKGSMLATADVADGNVRVVYESAPHEFVEESCNAEGAAALIDAVMARTILCRVPKARE